MKKFIFLFAVVASYSAHAQDPSQEERAKKARDSAVQSLISEDIFGVRKCVADMAIADKRYQHDLAELQEKAGKKVKEIVGKFRDQVDYFYDDLNEIRGPMAEDMKALRDNDQARNNGELSAVVLKAMDRQKAEILERVKKRVKEVYGKKCTVTEEGLTIKIVHKDHAQEAYLVFDSATGTLKFVNMSLPVEISSYAENIYALGSEAAPVVEINGQSIDAWKTDYVRNHETADMKKRNTTCADSQASIDTLLGEIASLRDDGSVTVDFDAAFAAASGRYSKELTKKNKEYGLEEVLGKVRESDIEHGFVPKQAKVGG